MAKLPVVNFWINDGDGSSCSGESDFETLLLPGESQRCSPLRAVHSALVLKDFAYVLASKSKPRTEGAADALFNLSEAHPELRELDYFISHSWSAGRLAKWVALADVHYRSRATVLANSYWLLATSFAVPWRLHSQQAMDPSSAFVLFTLTPGLILCLVTSLGDRIFPDVGSMVFLDRVCIHQWDDELKCQGIRALGDVLRRSAQLVILCSDDYFHRLWCIFEVATFNGHRRASRDMMLVHLWVAPFLYGMLLCNLSVLAFNTLLLQNNGLILLLEFFGEPAGAGMIWVLCNLLPACVICFMLRRGMLQKLAMEGWVAHFELDAGQVTVEEDRSFIYGEIESHFGSLDAFESFVRRGMLQQLHKAMGPDWSFPWTWGAFVFQPYVWYLCTDALSMPDETIAAQVASTSRSVAADWVWYLVTCIQFYGMFFVLLPLAVKAVGLWAHLTRRFPLWLGIVLDAFAFLSLVFIIASLSTVIWDLLFAHKLVLEQPPFSLSSQ